MDDAEQAYRDALAAHHRRVLRTAPLTSLLGGVLVSFWRLRIAWRAGERWTLAGVALKVVSGVVNAVVDHQRADRRADEEITQARQMREVSVQAAEARSSPRETVTLPGPQQPFGHSPIGCLAMLGLLLAGHAQAGWDYLHRPGRDHRSRGAGGWWSWRPGPVWWAAWSWQQLPVNATSTAPRSEQIAYEQRQVVTLRATGLAATTIGTWNSQLHPAYRDQERARLAAGVLKIVASAVEGVGDYRRVPAKVDAQRARRRQHQATVAAVELARATGGPEPSNPYQTDMTVAAGIVTGFAATLAVNGHRLRQRPTPPAAWR